MLSQSANNKPTNEDTARIMLVQSVEQRDGRKCWSMTRPFASAKTAESFFWERVEGLIATIVGTVIYIHLHNFHGELVATQLRRLHLLLLPNESNYPLPIDLARHDTCPVHSLDYSRDTREYLPSPTSPKLATSVHRIASSL